MASINQSQNSQDEQRSAQSKTRRSSQKSETERKSDSFVWKEDPTSLYDFSQEIRQLTQNKFQNDGHLKDFYIKSTAAHEMPNLKMEFARHLPSNPKIFAVLSKASDFFEVTEVKEFMMFEDYVKLSKIRVRNYVTILRMLTKVDANLYDQVKIKLYQIQKLCSYLDLKLEKVFERLHENQQIYDLEVNLSESKAVSLKDQSKKSSRKASKEEKRSNQESEKDEDDEQSQEQDKEEGNDEQKDDEDGYGSENKSDFDSEEDESCDEDKEYELFYKFSELESRFRATFTHELEREEEKWLKRAEWLESKLQDLSKSENTKMWAPWFQAKIDQLADLDVPIKNTTKVEDPNIFYLHKFIDQQIRKFNPDQEYHKDQMVYPQENNGYPQYEFDTDAYVNESSASFKAWINIREKLCHRINKREKDTDYLLTVFEKKPFGNEKIYEKRLNFRGKRIQSFDPDSDEFNLTFHSNGRYLYLKFTLESSEETSPKFELIFPLNARYKDPLYLKKGGHYIGFYDKCFYSLNQLKESKTKTGPKVTKDEDAGAEEEQKDETLKPGGDNDTVEDASAQQDDDVEDEGFSLKLLEYDLQDFTKVRTLDFNYLKGLSEEDLNTDPYQKFGKYKDGVFYISEKKSDDKKTHNYEVFLKGDKYSMSSSEEQFQQDTSDYPNRVYLTEKGDKLLVISMKGDNYVLQRYNLDSKDKKIKRAEQIKIKLENSDMTKSNVDHVKAKGLMNDFLIFVCLKKDKNAENFVYLNDQLITSKQDHSFEDDEFFQNEKGLIKIMVNENEEFTGNSIQYTVCEQVVDKDKKDDKKEYVWNTVTHEIYNRAHSICFPYAFCIYNHDQVYMKDLTKRDGQGIYYMNSFLGIEDYQRPIAIHCITYNNKLNLSIPVINSKYTSNDFFIKVHQIKTMHEQNDIFRIKGHIRFRVYMYNQEIMSVLQQWSGLCDSKNHLHSDIRMFSHANAFHLEQWEKNKCLQRIIVTHFHAALDLDERDVTNTDCELNFQPSGSWLILTHKNDGSNQQISVYTRYMRYSFDFDDLLELENCWDYTDDEPGNEIYQILIDTLPKDKIDLYIIYNDCKIRKFTAPLPKSDRDSYDPDYSLQFEESQAQFNIEDYFSSRKEKGSQNLKGQSNSGKKVSLYDALKENIVIANGVLYCSAGIIDLNAKVFKEKYIIGCRIDNDTLHIDISKAKFIQYSMNEAKLYIIQNSSEIEFTEYDSQEHPARQRINYMGFVLPLLNIRQIPIFQHMMFKHPVVPIVDKNIGCSYVFTLHLGQFQNSTEYITHEAGSHSSYKALININPGILIKYFNGVQQEIPMRLFGEEFLEITRINHARNGQFVLLTGVRKGPLKQRFCADPKVAERDYHPGMFLYSIQVNKMVLEQAILFAEKDFNSIEPALKEKLERAPKKFREYIYPEISGIHYGEYFQGNFEQDGYYESVDYQESINFQETDEEYLLQLRERRQKEIEDYRRKEEQERKRLEKSGRRTLLSNDDNEDNENHEVKSNPEKEDPNKINPFEKIEIATLEGLQTLFPGFDIPYLLANDGGGEILQIFDELDAQNVIKEKEIEENEEEGEIDRFETEIEKRLAPRWTDAQVQKINQLHDNIHLDINGIGHIFLINRLNNKLYFFYKVDDSYRLAVFKFDPDFVLNSVDSSRKYLMVKSCNNETHKFKVFKIENMLNCSDPHRKFTLSDLQEVYDSEKKERIEGDEQAGIEKYTYFINEMKLKGDKLILRIEDDQGIKYLKVIDLSRDVVTSYIEGEKFLISGDRKFIWNMQTNEIYDIINGLSTYFLWPGDLINSHSYTYSDLFNINNDRTIMATHGTLYLAFNFISMVIDDKLHDLQFKQSYPYLQNGGNFNYLCYKISNYKSILEKIFESDDDKGKTIDGVVNIELQEEEQEEEQEQEQDGKSQEFYIAQNKQVLSLLGYLTSLYTVENTDQAHLSNFFLSYYLIDADENKGDTLKEPKLMNIFEKMFSMGNDVRVDLIEDILNYVVNCKTVPITSSVINTCFTKFLGNANGSQAFQFYLSNIMIQTAKMADVEKFQITSTEQGFMVDSYVSPIMDDKFQNNFRVAKETKKDCEMHYIHLGTLLEDQGREIMDILTDKKYLSIMDIPFIRYLVMYQWQKAQYSIKNFLLWPFFSLVTLFTFYALTTDFTDVQYDAEGKEIVMQTTWVDILNMINAMLLILQLIYFFYMEFLQFRSDPKDYFSSFWNLTDLVSYTLCTIVVIFDITPIPNQVNRPLASICLIILWVKMFYFLRVFETTSRLIRMIIEIVNDMQNFLIVLVIGIIGFSGGFYILQQGSEGWVTGESQNLLPGHVPMNVIYTYRLAMGDFQIDFFDDLHGGDYFLAWFLFVVGTLFIVIVLLNLLIAIMGDTFSRVLENITNLSVREKVMLVSENEALFERNKLFNHAQFLIIIKEKNLDSVQAENWDGQINALKRQVLDKVTTLQDDLSFKIQESQKDIRKRIQDQDEKQKKVSSSQEQKLVTALKSEFGEAIEKSNDQFNQVQMQLKTHQNLAAEQMRTLKMVQEQMQQLQFTVSRMAGPKGKTFSDSDEE